MSIIINISDLLQRGTDAVWMVKDSYLVDQVILVLVYRRYAQGVSNVIGEL